MAMAVPEILISNGGLIRILRLSKIKMFYGIFTFIILSMSKQVTITTSNSFLLSHRVAMGASIGIQYFIRMYFNMLTVILYKTAMRHIAHSV